LAVIVAWLSWSVSTEVSDVVGSGGSTEILMDGFIAIAVARNFGISVEGVPETNAMSDFVGSSLESSSDVESVHPKSSSVGVGFWVPWEGSKSEEGSEEGGSLSGDIEVEISGWVLSVDALHGLDLGVPCRAEWTVGGDLGITGIWDEGGVDEVEGEVGSTKVFVDLVDLSVDLGLVDRAVSLRCADDGDEDVEVVCTSSP